MAAGVPSSVEFAPGLMSRDELVVYYSVVNYSCKEIQRLLQYVHGHIISIRHLWYLRKKYGVHARKNESEISCIIEAIQNEMEMADPSGISQGTPSTGAINSLPQEIQFSRTPLEYSIKERVHMQLYFKHNCHKILD